MDTNPGPIEPFFFGGHGHFELIIESGLGIYAAGGSIISKMTKIQESKFFLHAYQNVSNLKYIPTVMTLSRLVAVIGECRPMSVVGICRRPVIRVELSQDRKSTRLNSSHVAISYAVFCLKKKR